MKIFTQYRLSTSLFIYAFLFLTTVVATSCGSSRRTLAIEEGWDLLGEAKAGFVRDKDGVAVLTSNAYTAIRFQVENKDIVLKDLEVEFVNGDKLTPSIEDEISAGSLSRVIEIGAEGKMIRSVNFRYRSKGSLLKKRANILVFGKRYGY